MRVFHWQDLHQPEYRVLQAVGGFLLHSRRSFSLAFWCGCFAVLMMLGGPIISGAQGVLKQTGHSSLVHVHQDEHAEHHAMPGHIPNPHLPQWVNNLLMCGYCELLTLSPALMLALLFVLALTPSRVVVITWLVLDVFAPRLRPYAAPRAPPAFICC